MISINILMFQNDYSGYSVENEGNIGGIKKDQIRDYYFRCFGLQM